MADVYSTKIYNTLMGNGAALVYDHLSASASAGTTSDFVGPVAYRVAGDLGGGTVSIKAQVSAGYYQTIQGSSATAATDQLIDFPSGALNTVYPVLTGGAAASCDIVLQGYTQ